MPDQELEKSDTNGSAGGIEEASSHLLTLFNYQWLKFLTKKRLIEQERKLREDELRTLENSHKIDKMKGLIETLE